MFHVPNKYRNSKHAHLATDDTASNNGYFQIPHPKRGFSTTINCIASDGDGWEHVSVSVLVTGMEPQRVPDWSEMCFIKDIFWDEEDTVIQFHPPKSEYINMHNFVLHLWRRSGENFDTPPTPKSEYINMHNFVLHLWRRSGENFDTPPKIMVGV